MKTNPRTIVLQADDGQVVGFVSIDSTINGRARGGLRMLPDVSEDELGKLARAMTLKYGFLGLPQGGAKAGVIAHPDAAPEVRASALLRFAHAARPLLARRTYVPDADMGTSGEEIQRMLAGIGLRTSPREYRGDRSGDYTAGTVFEAARAAAGLQGLELKACRVAIEGFGKVGGPLAEMFARAGASVVAVSTASGGLYHPRGLDIARLRQASRRSWGSLAENHMQGQSVPSAALKEVPVEIFCPCARHDCIGEEDVARMPAKVVSCGANSPVTPKADRMLWERGVLCVPDFVANCGGVLGGTMEFAGWQPEEIFDFYARRFRGRVESLVRTALRSARPLRDVAEEVSLERFDQVKRQAESPSWRSRAMLMGLAIYREGWLPRRLVRRLSEGYFQHRLSQSILTSCDH